MIDSARDARALMRPFLLLAILLSAASVHADEPDGEPVIWDGNLKPAWLKNDDTDTGGIEFQGSATYTSKFANIRLLTEGTLTLDEDLNPTPIVAELISWWTWDMRQSPKEIAGTNDPFSSPDEPMQKGYDYGTIELGLEARYETDQARNNYGWAAGAQFGYISVANIFPDIPLNFSAYANFEWVGVTASEPHSLLSLDEEDHGRFRFAGSLKYKIGEHTQNEFFQPLALHGDLRYFQDFDQPDQIKNSGYDSDVYWAVALSYEMGERLAPIDAIFIKFSEGAIPPATYDDTTFFLGIVFGEF